MGRRLKDWLKAYLEYTSLSEAPEIFHFWTGVSTIAGALQRRVWINQKYFEWTPNFYIIFVAPAGVATKSTTIRVGQDLLREVDGIHFGPDSGTWQAIGKKLMEAQVMVPKDERGLEGEFESMACITCAPGELGTFLDFNDGKLVDVLTSLWDGQRETFEHSTSTQGTILIENPWINIISATTPSWLKKNVPEEAIGGGFASRVIFVFGSKKRQLVAYPGMVGDNNRHAKLRADLVHDLKDIAEMFGEMLLSPEAIQWGENWYEKHWSDRPVHMASDRFDGYIARKQTHLHKLAMVLSAANSSDKIITEEHLRKAEHITTAMENDMINVFESIGVAPMSRLLHEIISFVNTYQQQGLEVSRKLLWRHCLQIMSQQEFAEATGSAVQAGYLSIANRGGEDYYSLKIPIEEISKGKGGANKTPGDKVKKLVTSK